MAHEPDGVIDFGATPVTFFVSGTGDQNVDGLLEGVRWTTADISYSFPSIISDYNSGSYPDYASHSTNFSAFTAKQEGSAVYWLNQYAAVSGLSFVELTGAPGALDEDQEATLRFANSSDPSTAYAYYPNSSDYGGDMWFGPSGDAPDLGDYDWHTIGHELGHALGLKHGQESGGIAGAMNADRDSMEFSIMTYRSYVNDPLIGGYSNASDSYAQSLMMYDIRAIQQMYGADFGSNSTNTTYSFSTTTGEMSINGVAQGVPIGNKIFRTIWDGNGSDTYDFSNYTNNISIDLRPGFWTDLHVGGNSQRANLGDGNFSRGHVFNALQYNGDTRSLIESAIGGSGNDRITGNTADNTLYGGAGRDTMDGGDGADLIKGGGGDDSLIGGWGQDNLFGDLDNDRIEGGFDVDSVNGGDGNDVILFSAGAFIDNVEGGNGDDTLDARSHTSDATYDFNAGTIVGFGGTTTLSGIETLQGSNTAADTIYSDGSGTFNGNGGDDTIYAGLGTFETLNGGAGTDLLDTTSWGGDYVIDMVTGVTNYVGESYLNFENLTTGAGNDSITGTGAVNTIITGDGNDTIDGGSGNDLLKGAGGDDSLLGGFGEDVLLGGLGNDRLDGGLDVDSIFGEDGNDVILFVSANFMDNVDGGTGDDTLDASGHIIGATYDFVAGSIIGHGGTTTLANIETLYASNTANDTIRSDGGGFFYGGGGNDFMAGGLGTFETLDGGTGNDTIDTTSWGGNYVLDLNTGDTNYDPELYANFENAITGAGNDTITGTAGVNTISTGAGNDVIIGLGGRDVINGGAGDDTLVINNGDAPDTFDGGTEIDTINASALTTGLTLNFITGAWSTAAGNGSASNVEIAYGSNTATDRMTSDGSATLYGGGGNDTMFAGLGVDEDFFGGNGLDTLNTTQFGGNYSVNLVNGQTNFAGEDYLGFENLITGAGNDTLTGTVGNNSLNGGAGADSIFGSNGNDRLYGGTGNDVLDGGSQNDQLYGGTENDVLNGGTGNDTLSGAAGSDSFVFITNWGDDNIVAGDFTGGPGIVDVLNFSALGIGLGNLTISSAAAGASTLIELTGFGDSLLLNGVAFGTLSVDDFVF